MKQTLDVKVENYGNVHLENHGGYYYATDDCENFLGEIYPDEIDDWDESDEHILSSIIEDMIDDGELEMPSTEDDEFNDSYED